MADDVAITAGSGTTVATDDASGRHVQLFKIAAALGGSAAHELTNDSSTAYEASNILKASAGVLYGLTVHSSRTSAQFIQLHNTTTVPADTAVPVWVMYVPASTTVAVDFGLFGRSFATGITVCNSSTGPTKTIGSADCWFDAQFV